MAVVRTGKGDPAVEEDFWLFMNFPNVKHVKSGGEVSKWEYPISGWQPLGSEDGGRDECILGSHLWTVGRFLKRKNGQAPRGAKCWNKTQGRREKGVPELMAVGQAKGRRSRSHLHEQMVRASHGLSGVGTAQCQLR